AERVPRDRPPASGPLPRVIPYGKRLCAPASADGRMAPRSKGRGRTQADLTLKITLAGNPGVGKTSLTRRFVTDTFEERYISTLGTKISSKEFAVDDPSRPGSSVTVSAAIWDIMGNHQFRELHRPWFETSAKTGANVEAAFRRVATDHLRTLNRPADAAPPEA